MSSIYEMSTEEIIKYLDLPVREMEKHKYGEVMTPPDLINDVLDHLPDTVWRNPDLKWLDPAAGIGNFFILIYGRLMRGLARKIPDTKKRADHIIQKMLFMSELNPENIAKIRKLFGPKANIIQADFLELCEKKGDEWAIFPSEEPVSKFDIILENPPYQISNKGSANWGAKGRSHTLWPDFIEKSLELLVPGGYLGAITPPSWRSPQHPLLAELKDKRYLKYLHIYDKQSGLKLFQAQTRFDIYIVQNVVPSAKEKTEIVDEKGKSLQMSVHTWPFLPNYLYREIKEILVLKPTTKSAEQKGTRKNRPQIKTMEPIYHSNLYCSKELVNKPMGRWRNPVVHTITKKGLGFIYSNRKQAEHIGVPKVLLNFNENQYPYNDYKGEYGMSQLTFGIPIRTKKEGDDLVAYINSPFFKEVIKATKWGAFYTNYKMFGYFRYPTI